MAEMLVRLDDAAIRQMKRDIRIHFYGVQHSLALEALARGLGVGSYAALRAFAEEFGAIRWSGDDRAAAAFLADRGVTMREGVVSNVVSDHNMDHEAMVRSAEGLLQSGSHA